MSDAAYRVKIDAFEGPLDLLLHLVRKNEVDIYHLPIAEITDQYLAYLAMFEELNLDVAGEYLVMAASLMYLKSRLLLPVDEDAEEEDEDPVGDLVRQLAEYQRYREVAEALRDRVLLDRDVFRRQPTPPTEDLEPTGFRPVELADLFEALRGVLEAARARKPHVVGTEEYSVRDAVQGMLTRLRRKERTRFDELFGPSTPRGVIVATFVGLLELVRVGAVRAEQDGSDGPIVLRLVDDRGDDTLSAIAQTVPSGGQSEREVSEEGAA